MTDAILQSFERLERSRDEVARIAVGLSDAQRDWRSKPAAWSVREIVEHLVLSDETVGRALESVPNEPFPLRLTPRALRRALILAALRRDVALPLPSPALEPRGKATLDELLDRWQASRTLLRVDLGEPGGVRLRYAHPVLGPLNAAQMLELGIAHSDYHVRQVAALRLDPTFPA